MIRFSLLPALMAVAGCSVTFGAPPQVVSLPAEVALRSGVVVPAAERVTVNGAAYRFALIRDGGNQPYSQPGGALRYADAVLVGGTDDKLAAVDVYLAQCYPGRARDTAWGDEYIPRLATGEWLFDYPEGCPARGSAPLL